MTNPLAVTDATFEAEVLKAGPPVLVDFWAGWCMPCRVLAPIVEELTGEYQGRLKVVKVDVDANPETASTYRIRSIPTLLLFRGGKVVDQMVGASPKAVLKGRLEAALAKEGAARVVGM